MADDLHLHIRDHMNDCIRGILGAVANELNDRARALRKGTGSTVQRRSLLVPQPGPIEALELAAQDIEHMAKQFR